MQRKILIIAAVLLVVFFSFEKLSSTKEIPDSRKWMEYAMEIVKEKKPAPTESAWFYAAVATAYDQGLNSTNFKTEAEKKSYANIRTSELINFIYPEKKASTSEFVTANNLILGTFPENKLAAEDIQFFINEYNQNKNIPEIKRPAGNRYNQYWFSDKKPFTPEAGKWQRWQLGSAEKVFDFQVSLPPIYASGEYIEKLKEVKLASDLRTSEQGALINFWGGVPGTEQPAGIWQNRLWDETKNEKTFSLFSKYSNREYSKIQTYLAQALSDSFMECWKVKYAHNTKRPSMAAEVFEKQIGGPINLAMPNPPFPSYTSGHSTISATAAEILCVLVNEKCEIWKKDALNAKNSRLWAGIHFSYDNDEGEKLGKEIGEYYKNIIIPTTKN